MDLDSARSCMCSSPDCKWFTLIFIHIEFTVRFSSLSPLRVVLRLQFLLTFVSFFMWFDLWLSGAVRCANGESTWLFIHDQCQMQANKLRDSLKRRRRDIAPDSCNHFGILSSVSLMDGLWFEIIFFFCLVLVLFVCSMRDSRRLHDFYLGDGAGQTQLETTKKLTKNSN